MTIARCVFGLLALLVATAPSRAEEAVAIGAALALLTKPADAKGSVILIPGGDGIMGIEASGRFSKLGGNQLVRTRKSYATHGLASLTVDHGVKIADAIAYMRKIASPVIVVATSRGSLRVPGALAAKPDGLVLTSAFLDQVRSSIRADALPATLVIHHRQDGCHHTPPAAVAPFKAWGGDKISVAWIEGGSDSGDPCQARGYHGFNGRDDRVVETVAKFALARR